MKKLSIFSSLLILLSLVVACTTPRTPQEVAQAFWQAVLDNNAEKVVRYSTLNSPSQYDRFSHDWNKLQPSWGKVVIENKNASIVTRFSPPTNEDDNSLKFVTYLVKQEGSWKVDYARTSQAVSASLSMTQFFKKLNRLGQEFSQKLEEATTELTVKLESMAQQFDELANSLDGEVTESIRQHSEQLRQYLDDLVNSIERALKEKGGAASDEDKQNLNQAVTDLNRSSDALSQPDIQSVSECSQTIASVWKNIEALDEETFGSYKQQWQAWGADIENNMQQLLDQLVTDKKQSGT